MVAVDLQKRYEEELKKRLGEQGAAEWLKKYPTYGGYVGSATGGQYVGTGGLTSPPKSALRIGSSGAASPALQQALSYLGTAPKTYTAPSIQERPGQTVDLSRWFQAIGQQPRQWQVPQATTPQVFNLQQLQQAMSRPLPEPAQPRFATPEQLGQWIAQFQQVQEPWLQAATELARAEANRQLQQLQSQWAARGLLASGGAMAQEREAAENLARQLAETRTRALAEAVGQALQAGQLSLEEAAQLWRQAYEARQADVENLLRALSQQEQMRQWEQAFGLDVERLRSQDWANWLDALARAYQTEVQQQQWAQELGVQRAAQEFQRWLQTQQLNQQAQQAWLDALLRGAGLQEEARQFERRMPLWEAELTGLLYGLPTLEAQRLREQQRQFNIGAAMDLSRLFGRAVQPAMSGAALFGQVAGMPTWERALQEARYLTGMYQGRPTWERLLQEAELTGYYQGRPTLERWWRQQQLAQAAAEGRQLTRQDRLAAAIQGAINLVDELMSGRYIGMPSDVGTSRGPQYVRLSPEEAAKQATRIVMSQIGELGLTWNEVQDVIEAIYERAGVSRSPAKQRSALEAMADAAVEAVRQQYGMR